MSKVDTDSTRLIGPSSLATRWCLILAMIMATQGCTSTELQWLRDNTVVFASPLQVSKGKLFCITKSDREMGWGKNMHPFLMFSPSGRIGLHYFAVGDEVLQTGFSEVDYPFYSDDMGKTWIHGNPFALPGEALDRKTILSKGESLPKKGLVDVIYAGNLTLSSNRWVVYDYLATFSNAIGRWTGPDGFWREPESSSIQMPPAKYPDVLAIQYGCVDKAGNIYLTAYHSNPAGMRNGFHSILLVSRDGGAHFDYVSTIARPDDVLDSLEGPGEPGMVMFPDGEMLVVMRTGGHVPRKMLAARSKDFGKSWTLSDMPFSGVQPKLVLMSNGVLALATGRPGNYIYFSMDGGLTWPRKEAIMDNYPSTGYIDIKEVSPGRLLAVFDIFGGPDPTMRIVDPTKKVNGIYGMFVDVEYTPPENEQKQ